MRFSVLNLLALTLLVTLTTAIFVKRNATSSASARLSDLEAEIAKASDDCREKERAIGSLRRITTRRATDIELMRLTADRLEGRVNTIVLKTAEPPPHRDNVSRNFIPTSSCGHEFRERTIIYLPDEIAAEIRVTFHGGGRRSDYFEDFEEPSRRVVPLIAGENLIEVTFDWERVPNLFVVTNHTTGVSLSSRAKDARGSNWFPALGQGSYRSETFSPGRGMTLFEGGLGFKHGTFIAVKLVGSPTP